MLSPGTVVERYKVECKLGGGGMADVYKVRHISLGSQHALKVLKPELFLNPDLRSRFFDRLLEEGRIQARLKHPNIVSITDVVCSPGTAGLVMEYLEGESLESHLARQPHPTTPDKVRNIFRQILEGMQFAHEQGIIHRDINPSNIFLERVRGGRVVRILDFGIAKVLSPEFGELTRAGDRMGTPQYVSPEQRLSARDVTIRSDIFSLGATLYELATGHPCFEREGQSDYILPHKLYPQIDRQIAAAITKALETDPKRRFVSCKDFAAALATAKRNKQTPTSRPAARAGVSPTPVTRASRIQANPHRSNLNICFRSHHSRPRVGGNSCSFPWRPTVACSSISRESSSTFHTFLGLDGISARFHDWRRLGFGSTPGFIVFC